ncbi:DDE_3 domain-containing protein [Trichonephila clavipes]|nr:DDE_3 domain-containing protein [Trichonephila clavipes]
MTAHRSLFVTDFLAKTKTTILPRPSYSSDNTPCDFTLFPELAYYLKGRRYQSADEIKSVSRTDLKDMGKNGFQKCFDDLYKQCQKCVAAQGSYFEGGCVSQQFNWQYFLSYRLSPGTFESSLPNPFAQFFVIVTL